MNESHGKLGMQGGGRDFLTLTYTHVQMLMKRS